jgi:hypothetical protein
MSLSAPTEPLTVTSPRLDGFLALDPSAPREQATWVYTALRNLLDVPASLRTDQLIRFIAEIDSHPRGSEIRDILHDFWSHHSYIRVISEAGLPNEVFLLRELLARAWSPPSPTACAFAAG